MQLPAVLQVGGQAPCFGIIAALGEAGLAFDFHVCAPPPDLVGSKALLDFSVQGEHYAIATLFVHVQGKRALLSLRDAPVRALAALAAATRHSAPPLAASLAILQRQQACHARFMEGMHAVVGGFYRHLMDEIEHARSHALAPTARTRLDDLYPSVERLRDALTEQFCRAYPMYPEQRASYADTHKAEATLDLVDTEKIDDWIQRTTVAQRIEEALAPLPHTFNRHYNALLKNDYTELAHPYRLASVLDVLADCIAPLGIDAAARLLCYKAMGQAFRDEAKTLYPALIQTLGTQSEETRAPSHGTDLVTWLRQATAAPENAPATAAGQAPEALAGAVDLSELRALFERLGAFLDALPLPPAGTAPADNPALSAYARILARFLPPAVPEVTLTESTLAAESFGRTLGALGGLDTAALSALRAQLQQPPPLDPGPEHLPESSQIREFMQQAQGLVMQYLVNGLTYEASPDHPAWTLLNLLDDLHLGADDQGRLLDPAHYRAVALAMQWLLAQDAPDAALQQVNALLAALVNDLRAARQARRAAILTELGADPGRKTLGWCIVRQDDAAIPYELLGAFDLGHVLINRSATARLELTRERFAADLDAGILEETDAYDRPFLARSASAALTAGLTAIHAYTWKDPACGCLKRSALMDELERRLEHPVLDPPTFCALIEIPSMRPSLSSLPGDELSVLQTKTGELLGKALETGEHCGRLSDVAFLIVFAPQDPQRVATRLASLKSEIESLHPSWTMIGAVVPLVAPDETTPSPSSVLRRANLACTGIRQQGGFELGGLQAVAPEASLPDALPLSSLYLRCQKIQPCTGNAPAHYEILLGLDEALASLHSTQSFVVKAEQSGRIHEVDLWVLNSTFDWMRRNADLLERLSGFSVNISGASITQPEHVQAMARMFEDHPELAAKIILEVTETSAIDNLENAVRALRKLKKLGCRIALDDFGSGYSSYGYIRRLPLDYLKIDGTYIRNILNDRTDQALTASMVDVAHALGLKVIAEYVDSEATYAWLKDLGVDYVQGYWVHEPQALDTLALP